MSAVNSALSLDLLDHVPLLLCPPVGVFLPALLLAAYASAACIYREVAEGALYECLSVTLLLKGERLLARPPDSSSFPIDLDLPTGLLDLPVVDQSPPRDLVGEGGTILLEPAEPSFAAAAAAALLSLAELLPNFGIFMLAIRLLSLDLLLLPTVFLGLAADSLVDSALVALLVHSSGSGEIVRVGEMLGSVLHFLVGVCPSFRSSSSSSLEEMVELHSEATVRLDSGRSEIWFESITIW